MPTPSVYSRVADERDKLRSALAYLEESISDLRRLTPEGVRTQMNTIAMAKLDKALERANKLLEEIQ